jgi:UDP-N-acetylglucosamine 1-carboxyvinyltransferase
MDAFIIKGGRELHGTVRVHGSKNASLPLMAAALLADGPVILRDVPDLSDIRNMTRLLGTLGCETSIDDTDPSRPLTIHATDPSQTAAPYEIVKTMRAGICVLGPLLAKRGKARVSMPGGCAIGDRPVDLHLRGLRALGAEITLDAGDIVATAPSGGKSGGGGRLIGGHVFLGGPSGSTVLGTANVLCAAVLAKGQTVIECAACEPEIEDLANLLTKMGAKIQGAGSPRLIIEGVDQLSGADHRVIPDRIEAGTYVMAAAITRGNVTLENFPTDALGAALDRLSAIGVEVTPVSTNGQAMDRHRGAVNVKTADTLKPVQVFTQPHPGFPTDLQAQIMSLLSLADGNSTITEKIFPDRFLHVAELLRMGANLTRNGPSVIVTGENELIGAPVMASDLRASAGLVLAGLAAKGTTVINRVYHLDRGYERMEITLQALGADIQRVKEENL